LLSKSLQGEENSNLFFPGGITLQKNNQLKNLYKQNQEGDFVLEAFLDRYIDAFNEWDSAYLEIRDLNPGLLHFLERCSQDIPFKYGIELLFSVSEPREEETEKLIIRGVKANFSYKILREKTDLRLLFRRIKKYFAVAISLLILVFSLDPVMPQTLMARTLKEGMMIGGWVFLWQALSLFSFNRGEIVRKIRHYERFLSSKVSFRYEEEEVETE